MIRRSSGRTVARRTLIGALVLLFPVIAGCEAGNNAPTLEFHPANAGTDTTFNGIKISDAFVLGAPSGSVPAGSSASMFLTLFNQGSASDQLVSVSAPGWAASGKLSGGTIGLPVNSVVDLSGPEPSVVLSDLTKPLGGGEDISVTLDFSRAGTVTLDVPVQPMTSYFATYSPPPPTPAATPKTTPKKHAHTVAPTASSTAG